MQKDKIDSIGANQGDNGESIALDESGISVNGQGNNATPIDINIEIQLVPMEAEKNDKDDQTPLP